MSKEVAFRSDELVNLKGKDYPVVGGRLRLAHETNKELSIDTQLVQWDGEYAVIRCETTTTRGRYVGYGTANNKRDARLSGSLIELAETRSIARSLRFAGYGLEFTSFEEVSHESEETSPKDGPPKKKKPATLTVEDAVHKGGSNALALGMADDKATKARFMELFLMNWSKLMAPDDKPYTSMSEIPPNHAEVILDYLKSEGWIDELRQESLVPLKR
ncbi:MAG: hypothetical protein P8123_06345 [bacterium]